MKQTPLIGIKEARKLLGKEAKGLNDIQVMEMIVLLTDTAKYNLSKNNVNKSSESIELDS